MKRLVWIVLVGCGSAASSEDPETTQGAETVEATPVQAVVEAPALTDPIDGVSFIEIHALRAPDDPDRWHAIQWEEEHRYVAPRSDDPERKVEIAADDVQSLLNLFEEHRETFTLPVQTSDFLVVRAGFIAMDRAAAEDETGSAKETSTCRVWTESSHGRIARIQPSRRTTRVHHSRLVEAVPPDLSRVRARNSR